MQPIGEFHDSTFDRWVKFMTFPPAFDIKILWFFFLLRLTNLILWYFPMTDQWIFFLRMIDKYCFFPATDRRISWFFPLWLIDLLGEFFPPRPKKATCSQQWLQEAKKSALRIMHFLLPMSIIQNSTYSEKVTREIFCINHLSHFGPAVKSLQSIQ